MKDRLRRAASVECRLGSVGSRSASEVELTVRVIKPTFNSDAAAATRSDVLRLALEACLGIEMGPEDSDGRSTTGPQLRKASSAAAKAAKGKAK